jgi:6-phosphogluconolactonase
VLLIGCYTPPNGVGAGVVRALPDGRRRLLGALESPSFLVQHPTLPIVYAPEADSCHIAIAGGHLVTVQYAAGTVRVYRLDGDVAVGGRTHVMGGFVHPHMAAADSDGVLISDLGRDVVVRCALAGGRLTTEAEYAVPGGPRHFVRAGTRWHVTGERDGTLAAFTSSWEPVSRVAGLTVPSEVAVYDERFLYVASRGPDTISVFTVDGLRLVAEVPSGGGWPRHIAVEGDRLYVAHQHSHDVTTLRIDRSTGVPQYLRSFAVTSPSCVLPVRGIRRGTRLRVLTP